MTEKRKRQPSRRTAAPARPKMRLTDLGVRRVPGQAVWELVHPRGARERAEDIEEVRHMIDAGEYDVALDELRWLLNGCGDFVDAHRLLGELALVENDARLARGHFGYAYEIGISAIEQAGTDGLFPFSREANRAFLECAKGLAHCLKEMNKPEIARPVLERLLQLDPSDPLGARAMLEQP